MLNKITNAMFTFVLIVSAFALVMFFSRQMFPQAWAASSISDYELVYETDSLRVDNSKTMVREAVVAKCKTEKALAQLKMDKTYKMEEIPSTKQFTTWRIKAARNCDSVVINYSSVFQPNL
jgi:hypothetical protein